MSLSSRLADGISELQRRRGLVYFQQGRARLVQSDGGFAEYDVRGSTSYSVTLAIEGDILYCGCSCPYFDDREDPCKHIWAAILDCERSGALEAGERVLM